MLKLKTYSAALLAVLLMSQTLLAHAQLPDFTGLGLGRALLLAQRAGLRLEISGSGHVVSQEPQPGSVRRGIVCQLRLAPTL